MCGPPACRMCISRLARRWAHIERNLQPVQQYTRHPGGNRCLGRAPWVCCMADDPRLLKSKSQLEFALLRDQECPSNMPGEQASALEVQKVLLRGRLWCSLSSQSAFQSKPEVVNLPSYKD